MAMQQTGPAEAPRTPSGPVTVPGSPAQEAVTVQPAPLPPRQSLRTELGFDPSPLIAMVIIFVVGPLMIAISRIIWKRSSTPALPPGLAEVPRRLERLEQAMDTVAIEVERISESQRFVARLMAESADSRKEKLTAGPGGTS